MTYRRGKAAPWPVLGSIDQLRLYGIGGEISEDDPELRIRPDPLRPVTPLKEMPDAVVAIIESSRVLAVEELHTRPEVRPRRLDNEVHVVRHQAEGKDLPSPAPSDFGEDLQIHLTVIVVAEDHLFCDPSRPHVKDAVFHLFAKPSRHIPMRGAAIRTLPSLEKGSDPVSKDHAGGGAAISSTF